MDRVAGTREASHEEGTAPLRSDWWEYITTIKAGDSSGTSDEAPVMGVEQ
jgi:hypothetical protein